MIVWDEKRITKEEYDKHDGDFSVDYRKEPIYKPYCGILEQIKHYDEPPIGYKYYKRKNTYKIVCIVTSEIAEALYKLKDENTRSRIHR